MTNNHDNTSTRSGASESFFVSLTRKLSLLLAASVVAVIVLYPRLIAEDSASVPHGWLVMMMFGMSACWFYGFQFEPKNVWLARLLPLVGWTLIGVASWKMFF